jgi:hypothetical protein
MGVYIVDEKIKLAKASVYNGATSPFEGGEGNFYFPSGAVDQQFQVMGLSPEKLIIPRNYHAVIKMCYDFYQRGGVVGTVINRLQEFSITKIRNGQDRKTTDECETYFNSVLVRNPSKMTRFLNNVALEYYLSGLVIPRVDYIDFKGRDISPDLKSNKTYKMPIFDWYPPLLTYIEWIGWGKRAFYSKVPSSDIKLIRNSSGKEIKEQQLKLRLQMYETQFPMWVEDIRNGADKVQIPDPVNYIMRKETSYSPYPTPYLYNVLEPLTYKQQLRRMDFAVASRVINAILLVQEGDRDFPITEETRENLDELKVQILARANNPRLMERLFILFSNHTTKLTWIHPDVAAMLSQDKYTQVNEELSEGLGFPGILVAGVAGRSGTGAEVSTWALLPMMERLREELIDWVSSQYEIIGDMNGFRNIPVPEFTPPKLQDSVKTAAVFAQAFKEGNISRTTRDDMLGLNFNSEIELMKDELVDMKGLPAFPPMPYSPLPPGGGLFGQPQSPNTKSINGRPTGTQNPPTSPRKTGTPKPSGQQPVSRLSAEIMEDEEVINLITRIAESTGIEITLEKLDQIGGILEE